MPISVRQSGPAKTPSGMPRHVTAGGMHELHGTPIYVPTGVGRERDKAPQLRLGVLGDIERVANRLGGVSG